MTVDTAMEYDVVVIGAGAAGLFCAGVAGQRGLKVLLLDHSERVAEKIRISGGGRCNFTNREVTPANFIGENPHFCRSALSRYTPTDFLQLLQRHGIAFHEKHKGQLFCDHLAEDIIQMLLRECDAGGVTRWQPCRVQGMRVAPVQGGSGYAIDSDRGEVLTRNVVVATGGLSIPKIGASDFGYRVAQQFGLRLVPTAPALVPLTFSGEMLEKLSPLAGVAVPARIRCGKTSFDEALLFTHRGLSGPAILQISSYWREGREIAVDLLPGTGALEALRAARQQNGRQSAHTLLATLLPRRLAKMVAETPDYDGALGGLADEKLRRLAAAVNDWRLTPTGTEGYRTAEVTLGGVDTNGLDSKTMQAKAVPGLYFIGEVVDVTGWLGGYNFQWAWSSGWCAGMAA